MLSSVVPPIKKLLEGHFLDRVKDGAQGFQIDKIVVARNLDFNPLNTLKPDEALCEGLVAAVGEMLEKCRRLDPEFCLASEHSQDRFIPYVDVAYRACGGYNMSPLRYVFPEWTAAQHIGAPRDFRGVNGAVMNGAVICVEPKNYMGSLADPLYRDLAEYIREVERIRAELAEIVFLGKYLDELGAEVVDSGRPSPAKALYYAVHEHAKNGRRAIVVANDSAKPRTYTWRFTERAGETGHAPRPVRAAAHRGCGNGGRDRRGGASYFGWGMRMCRTDCQGAMRSVGQLLELRRALSPPPLGRPERPPQAESLPHKNRRSLRRNEDIVVQMRVAQSRERERAVHASKGKATMNWLRLLTVTFPALCFVAAPVCAWGQAARASLSGTVYDASGAAVPGATVAMTDQERNATDTRKANEAGRYLFADVTPGSYIFEAVAPGFKKHRTTSLVLEVGQRLELNPTLEVGATTEEVTVTAGAVDIETATSAVSGVVESKQVSDLPLNGRDFYALLQLVPNVRAGAPGGAAVSVPSINGGRTWGAEAGVDGAPATSAGNPAPGAQGPGYQTGLDNVKEFRVLTNTLPAEYGNTYGGYISVVTKSGTNAFHGSAFEYLRNSRMDANNFFSNRAGLPLGAFRRNQFGASLGGPVIRNKTFFFVYYDGQRTAAGANQTRSVPTAAERTGDFSETRNAQGQRIVVYDSLTTRPDPSGSGNLRDAFPGNLVPQNRFDVVAQKVLTYLPPPNVPGNNFTHANNLITATPSSSRNNKIDGRVDHRFNDVHSVFGRVSYGKSRNYQPKPLGGLDDANEREQPNWNTVLDYTFVKSSVTVINAGFSYSWVTPVNIPAAARVDDYTALGFSSGFAKAIAPIFSYMPRFNLQIVNSWGPDNSSISRPTNVRIAGSVSRVAGKHTLKMGTDIRRIYGYSDPAESPKFSFTDALTRGPNPARATATAGYAFASFLLGAGNGSVDAGVPLDEGRAHRRHLSPGRLEGHPQAHPEPGRPLRPVLPAHGSQRHSELFQRGGA